MLLFVHAMIYFLSSSSRAGIAMSALPRITAESELINLSLISTVQSRAAWSNGSVQNKVTRVKNSTDNYFQVFHFICKSCLILNRKIFRVKILRNFRVNIESKRFVYALDYLVALPAPGA
jgi:hypothetical protein